MPTSRQNTNARSVFRSCFSFLQAAVMIVKNGNMVATVWAESIPYWATASNVAVLSLEKGDQVSTEREGERDKVRERAGREKKVYPTGQQRPM